MNAELERLQDKHVQYQHRIIPGDSLDICQLRYIVGRNRRPLDSIFKCLAGSPVLTTTTPLDFSTHQLKLTSFVVKRFTKVKRPHER